MVGTFHRKKSILASLVFVLYGFFKIVTYKIVTYTKMFPPLAPVLIGVESCKFQGILPL